MPSPSPPTINKMDSSFLSSAYFSFVLLVDLADVMHPLITDLFVNRAHPKSPIKQGLPLTDPYNFIKP